MGWIVAVRFASQKCTLRIVATDRIVADRVNRLPLMLQTADRFQDSPRFVERFFVFTVGDGIGN